MKQTIKLLISFVAGAVTAAGLLSFWLPPRVISGQSINGGPSPQWSLESFVTINEEITELVRDPNITIAVVPTLGGDGYNIVASDDRLRTRFGILSWDPALERIKVRMEDLRTKKSEAEQVAPSNH